MTQDNPPISRPRRLCRAVLVSPRWCALNLVLLWAVAVAAFPATNTLVDDLFIPAHRPASADVLLPVGVFLLACSLTISLLAAAGIATRRRRVVLALGLLGTLWPLGIALFSHRLHLAGIDLLISGLTVIPAWLALLVFRYLTARWHGLTAWLARTLLLLAIPQLVVMILLRNLPPWYGPVRDAILTTGGSVDKTLHLNIAIGLTFVAFLAGPGTRLKKTWALLVLLVMALSAPAVEIIQGSTGRGVERADVLAHVLGVCCGAIFILALRVIPLDQLPQPVATDATAGRSWKGLFLRLAVMALLALIGIETAGRTGLGLGNPPLYQTDPHIEYMLQPRQDLWRFGSHIRTNGYGMRSDEFPSTKFLDNEYRILVLGDGVVNGGTLTHHDHLATEIVRRGLTRRLNRPVVVGNASAGGWGPINELAYIEHFSLFDADDVFLVLTTGDAADTPTFEPLDPAIFPTRKPLCAITEGLGRYVPRYLEHRSSKTTQTDDTASPDPASLDAVTQLCARARAEGRRVFVLLHPDRDEFLQKQYRPEHDALRDAAAEGGATVIDLLPYYQAYGSAQRIYRDPAHLTPIGQAALARAINQAVQRPRTAHP